MKAMGPIVGAADLRVAKAPARVSDPYYQTPEWRALRLCCLKRDGYRCVKCGKPAIIADHILSRRAGGADALANLRSLCRRCDNADKEDHTGVRRGARGWGFSFPG